MRKTARLVLVLVVGSAPVLATADSLSLSFQQTWGGANNESAEGVAVASDGSVYVAGTTFSFGTGVADGDSDAFLLKYASNGTLVWQRTYGTGRVQPNLSADEFGNGVAVGPDDSVYVAGDSADGHALLVRFTSAGDLAWQRTWGGSGFETVQGVAVTGDGSVYLTGLTNSFGAGSGDAFLVKFAPGGTVIWERTWGGANDEIAQDIAIGVDGSIYVAGETNSFFGNDAFLLKYAPDGTLIWQRDWRAGGIQDESAAVGVATAPDGTVCIAGRALIAGVGQQIFLVNFTSDGSVDWQKTWGAQTDAALGVAVSATGEIFVTGNTGFGAGGGDAFIVEFTPTGRAKAARTWGGVDNESGQSVAVGPDGNIYIAAVASAPPYVFARASHNTKTPRAFLGTPNGAVTTPLGNVGDPTGIVLTPDGSQTFAGGRDAALLKVLP